MRGALAVTCRQLEAAERRRQSVREAERERELMVGAHAWRQAETIRAYVAHLASTIAASGEPASPEVAAWLTWASAVAEKLDPTSKRHR